MMANALMDVGSPLDDYFRDVVKGAEPRAPAAMGPVDLSNDTDGSGDATLVDSLHPARDSPIWASSLKARRTGVSPSVAAGPSTSSPPGGYPSRDTGLEAEVFAERFKYLVCSSGLLEKDWVSGLSDVRAEHNRADPEDEEEGLAELKFSTRTRGVTTGPTQLSQMMGKARARWDVVLAAMVVVVAVGVILGARRLIVNPGLVSGLAVLCAVAFTSYTFPEGRATSDHMILPDTPLDHLTPRSAALAALISLLTQSHLFDTAVDRSLALFQPTSPIQSQQALRLALHRLTGDMTDHLGTATSRLLQLADQEELAVLGEMYDIPTAPGSSSRKVRPSASDDSLEARTNVPSPRRQARPSLEHRSSSTTSADRSDASTSATSLAMSASHSLPGSFRPTHRTNHLSLVTNTVPTPRPPATSAEDRFTAIPPRTPRLSKRASWDSVIWSSVRKDSARRPPHERRITEADEEGEGDISSSADSNVSETAMQELPSNLSIPSSLRPPVPHTPTRTSPLSRRLPLTLDRHPALRSHTPSLSVDLLPSPLAADLTRVSPGIENPKRRSLQNMPYYRSSDDDPTTPPQIGRTPFLGASLSRTRSLPFSDLQELRSRSATGSRRTSLVAPPQQAFSPTPPARLSRVPSVSPLTVPALKAACLGIHLKRRRMACCLLGLRFRGVANGYWKEVKATLDDLIEAIVTEKEKLELARHEAQKSAGALTSLHALANLDYLPPWSISKRAVTDFAPRSSNQEVMLGHIDALQSALTKAWVDLVAVQGGVVRGDKTAPNSWNTFREDLGIMVREWERGKDVISRLIMTDLDGIDNDEEAITRETREVPEFLKAWEDGDESDIPTELKREAPSFEPEISLGTHEPYEGCQEQLPPPGLDEVFEATSLPARSDETALSGLSRDERIRLMKDARVKGISLSDLLDGEKALGDKVAEREVRANGGEVVSELRGMIGMIRRRKGHEDFEPEISIEEASGDGAENGKLHEDDSLARGRGRSED